MNNEFYKKYLLFDFMGKLETGSITKRKTSKLMLTQSPIFVIIFIKKKSFLSYQYIVSGEGGVRSVLHLIDGIDGGLHKSLLIYTVIIPRVAHNREIFKDAEVFNRIARGAFRG